MTCQQQMTEGRYARRDLTRKAMSTTVLPCAVQFAARSSDSRGGYSSSNGLVKYHVETLHYLSLERPPCHPAHACSCVCVCVCVCVLHHSSKAKGSATDSAPNPAHTSSSSPITSPPPLDPSPPRAPMPSSSPPPPPPPSCDALRLFHRMPSLFITWRERARVYSEFVRKRLRHTHTHTPIRTHTHAYAGRECAVSS